MALKKKNLFNVLIISPNHAESELYSELISEVADCAIDVKTRLDGSLNWIDGSNYHLVILDAYSISHKKQGEAQNLSPLELIKRISPSTGVIVLSANPTVEEAVAAVRLGAEDYLQKPFNLDSFKLSVRRGLDKGVIFKEDNQISKFLRLLTSCQMISATLNQDKIFQIIQSYFVRELNAKISAIYSFQNGEIVRKKNSSGSASEDEGTLEVLDIAVQSADPFAKMIEQDLTYLFIKRGHLTPAIFLFRFTCVGRVELFYACLSPEKPSDIETFESNLAMLKTQVQVTGKNIDEYRGVKTLVYIDDLTGLYNTRYLNEILTKEVALSKKSGQPFAVLFIDIDHFKQVNDRHGHLVGSKLLTLLGKDLKNYVRGSDKIFRYGGDEFVAVLPNCSLEMAKQVAERIRQSVESKSYLKSEGLQVQFTVSIGVALYPEHAKSGTAILKVADEVMYRAKKERNRVYLASSA